VLSRLSANVETSYGLGGDAGGGVVDEHAWDDSPAETAEGADPGAQSGVSLLPPADDSRPEIDAVAWKLAAAALLAEAVFTTAYAGVHSDLLLALSSVCWYTVGAAVVVVSWRRWGGAWALLLPWVAPLVFASSVAVLAPLFDFAWREGESQLFNVKPTWSLPDIVGLVAGGLLAYAIWRQSQTWYAAFPEPWTEWLDAGQRRMIAVGGLAVLTGWVVVSAYSRGAGAPGDVLSASSTTALLLLAWICVAFYADAFPRGAAWLLGIGGVLTAGWELRDLAYLPYTLAEGLYGDARGTVLVLSVIVTLATLAWSIYVGLAAVQLQASVRGIPSDAAREAAEDDEGA
jgi:hypothetical protein